jgi:hypothetical protein
MNTPTTNAVFRAHAVQSGGPTWGAILQALVRRHGNDIAALDAPPPGYPGFGAPYRVTTARGPIWFTLDDEGDAAVFCTGDAKLLGEVHDEYEHANHDRVQLEKALRKAAAFGLE